MDIQIISLPFQIGILISFLLFLLLSWKRPAFAALLFPMVLPLYLIKIYFDFPIAIPTNLLEVLIIIFLLVNYKLVSRGIKYIWMTTKMGKYFLFAIFFLLFSTILSTIFALNLRTALGAAKSWFVLPVFLFFALIPLLRSEKFREKFLFPLALSGVVVSLMSLPFIFANLLTYDERLSGLYLSPNHLAMALVPGILALLIQKSKIKNKNDKLKFKIAYYFLLILELITLYLTYSYSAWFGLFAAYLFLFYVSSFKFPAYRSGRQVSKSSLPYYLITFLLLVLLGISQLSNPKLQHIIKGDYYSSLHSRAMIWQSAWKICKDHWWSGVGVGNFQEAYLNYQKYFPEPYIEWAVPMPHNIFLAFQTQLGIIGLIAFILIVILSFTRIFVIPVQGGLPARLAEADGRTPPKPLATEREAQAGRQGIQEKNSLKIGIWKFIGNWDLRFGNLKNKLSKLDSLSLWAFAYLVYIILHGLIDTPYMKNDLAILFWLALAVIWGVKLTKERSKKYVTMDKTGEK